MSAEKPTLDDLLAHFDSLETKILALPKDPEILKQFFRLLVVVLPKIEPFLAAGIDVAAAASSGALGPFGPILGVAASLAGKFGIEALKDLAKRESV